MLGTRTMRSQHGVVFYIARFLVVAFVTLSFHSFYERVAGGILRKRSLSSYFSEKEVLQELRRFGELIHRQRIAPTCKIVAFGRNEYGRHDLCKRRYYSPCVSISYGVQNEYTFELDVRARLGCRVFALDPTVNHKAELADGVYFLKWAGVSKAKASHVGDMSSWFHASPSTLI